MPLATILVVEDDAPIRRGLVDALVYAGYEAHEAADGQAGLELALALPVDLVLLDVLMPRLDGLGVLHEVRRVRPALPVIFLTARGEEEDRVKGLRAGADDYVVKPFSASELLARVEAVLRRSAERPTDVRHLEFEGMRFDVERREVVRQDGTRSTLPQREAELLVYLARHAGRAVSRDELLQRVWGIDPRGMQTRTVDMTVARLRELLGEGSITTVRGKGYMFGAAPAGT
ncbi:MAG: response regulator transcription factor [Phycisphaerales bacterium]|nr:response regulator transcription factor [Phycisphaerales bacterium]